MMDSPLSNGYGKDSNHEKEDDVPFIQALESSSFSPAASPTSMDGQVHNKKKKKVLSVDTSPVHENVGVSLQIPVGTRSSPATLAQTPLANAMDVDDASLLEAFASVSYSPFAELRAEHKQAKSPVIFEDKEEEEEADFDDSATTATDMLQSGVDATNETFEVESVATTENLLEMPKSALSLDDLNHLMMSSDCVEEYNVMKKKAPASTRSYLEDDECYVSVGVQQILHASRGVEMERNSKIRKALIEEELSQLIELAQEDQDMDEFEPEAVEALGIAAYRLAYQRKYHDAKKGEDVYIPSVAYTVMDGSLLELASQHYFGKSDEFLVTYAGFIGSAITKQKQHYHEYNSNERENHPDAEDLNISNASETMDDSPMHQQPITPINSEQVMRFVWGVSPKASLMKDSTKHFSFSGVAADESSTERRFGARKIVAVAFCILALAGVAFLRAVAPSQMARSPVLMLPSAETLVTVPVDLQQTQISIFAKPTSKKSPKEDFVNAWKIVSSFWKQRFIASKELVTKTWKGAGLFFKQQVLVDLEAHMFEETSEQLSSLNELGSKKRMPNLLFEKETKQLAFTSVEDFQQGIAANRAIAKKKLEANKHGSQASDATMKMYIAESFSWNDC